MKNHSYEQGSQQGLLQAKLLVGNRITELSKYNLKLNFTLTLSKSQTCDVIFISIGDHIFLTVFTVLESNCSIFSPESSTHHLSSWEQLKLLLWPC